MTAGVLAIGLLVLVLLLVGYLVLCELGMPWDDLLDDDHDLYD